MASGDANFRNTCEVCDSKDSIRKHTVRYNELSPERFKSFWED